MKKILLVLTCLISLNILAAEVCDCSKPIVYKKWDCSMHDGEEYKRFNSAVKIAYCIDESSNKYDQKYWHEQYNLKFNLKN